MKSVTGTILMVFLLAACTATNRPLRAPAENVIDLSQDEEEYKLVVLDPGFETWFATTWNLAKDRSVDFYSHWNNQYAIAWNYKSMRPQTSQFFQNTIQYDAGVDYGIEVERKLYYYFRWVDTKLGIPILDIPPPGGI